MITIPPDKYPSEDPLFGVFFAPSFLCGKLKMFLSPYPDSPCFILTCYTVHILRDTPFCVFYCGSQVFVVCIESGKLRDHLALPSSDNGNWEAMSPLSFIGEIFLGLFFSSMEEVWGSWPTSLRCPG
jgi:hypothetical protein